MSLRRLPRGALVATALVTGGLVLSGCSGFPGHATAPARTVEDNSGHGGPPGAAARPGASATPAADPQLRRAAELQVKEIPALGPHTLKRIPESARQAVVVTGEAADSSHSTVVLYVRDPARGWEPVSDPWASRNALRGWTEDHHLGDLHSPAGVFGLTDAGGRKADPGTRLPYDHRSEFVAAGNGFEGESLAGAFDYVVAINYNHTPGRTPLDWSRPMGANRGGGVWIHVDHGGPTHGCVSLPEDRMKELLRWLDPSKEPVVVMGDASMLGK
ncbi:L,D-transpeptidase family protein [Streptomyces sp. NBC_00859]|uniref:L,D-transpeptidase family protein n=1 Tax=Streptomyces sp. NBC_00859 TaxID=2903682 RepID=UPI00386763B3|nr:L,D-transpeptidase family protein [Streptomyces sp. NBC_00859]